MMKQEKGRISELQEDWGKLRHVCVLVWTERRRYVKYIGVALLVGLVYVFSVPKIYTTSVMLAPEAPSMGLSGNMSSLASLAGMNIGGLTEDALAVDLYPNIVSSKDFLLQLFPARVKSADLEVDTTYSAYLKYYQKNTWWSYPVIWVGGLMKMWGSRDNDNTGQTMGENSTVIRLSEDEIGLCEAMRGRITCTVENITGVLTVTVADQDAEISAAMADTVVRRLNRFILDYRTHKARSDYEYVQGLCEEAKITYLEAQAQYAAFAASHTDIYAPDVKAQSEYLESESQLAYATYSQLKSQVQTAHAKVLESTPVYTVVESAYVPERAASPKKLLTLMLFIFIACCLATAKLFYNHCLRTDA